MTFWRKYGFNYQMAPLTISHISSTACISDDELIKIKSNIESFVLIDEQNEFN